MPRSLVRGRLLIVAACTVLCGVAHGDTMTQTEMISFAKQRMSGENDISSLELNQMYAGRKMLILPISGTSWPGTLRAMPDQFVSFLARQYKVRETADDLIPCYSQNFNEVHHQRCKIHSRRCASPWYSLIQNLQFHTWFLG